MAQQRIRATELGRLLNSAAQPIYVLDDERTLIFCNQACLDWLDQTPEELLGRRCAFHSSPEVTRTDAAAAGLCPPPAALAGREVTGLVACVTAEGRLRRRRARFVPLGGGPEDIVAVVVIVDPVDLGEPPAPALLEDEDESAWLHERIRDFRHQAAGRYRIDRLVGNSHAIRRVRAQIELAVASTASVLVVGPAGSGRQHVAGVIHYRGDPKSAGPLVPLACSVLGSELIHSTVSALAAKSSPGDQSDRGTLLLNDADYLPSDVQTELAVAFSGKPFPRRLISTAREPLLELARGGEFRPDLASMLSTIVIELPPLDQRREDVPLLAQLFLEEANAQSEKQLGGFTPEALDRLDAYPWPGNVDELLHTVAGAHDQAEGPMIGVGDLPQRIHLGIDAITHPRRVEETIVLDDFLARIEKELIQRSLAQAKGNKTKAAKLLGMSRPRLYRRLVQLGLEDEGGREKGEGGRRKAEGGRGRD